MVVLGNAHACILLYMLKPLLEITRWIAIQSKQSQRRCQGLQMKWLLRVGKLKISEHVGRRLIWVQLQDQLIWDNSRLSMSFVF